MAKPNPQRPQIILNGSVEIPLDRLHPADRNMRQAQTRPERDAWLAANIAANGLINPLTVVGNDDGDTYRVIAGARRLAALKGLAEDAEHPQWAADTPVRCTVVNDAADAEEAISLAENLHREAAHPVDTMESMLALHRRGLSSDDIGHLMGMPRSRIDGILRLQRVHPELRGIARNGGMSIALLHAFARSENHDAQMSIWHGLGAAADPDAVAEELLGTETMRADDPLVRLVGMDAYREAQGRVAEDLFSMTATQDRTDEARILDTGLVRQLAQRKLDDAANEARQQWGHVAIAESAAEAAMWDPHAEQVDPADGETYSTTEKNELTAVIYPAADGSIQIREGLRPARAGEAIQDDIQAAREAGDTAPIAATTPMRSVREPSAKLRAQLLDRRVHTVRRALHDALSGPEATTVLIELLPNDERGCLLWRDGALHADPTPENLSANGNGEDPVDATTARVRDAVTCRVRAAAVGDEWRIDGLTNVLGIDWATAWRPTSVDYFRAWSRGQLALWAEELTDSHALGTVMHRQEHAHRTADLFASLCRGDPKDATDAGLDADEAGRCAAILATWPARGFAPASVSDAWSAARIGPKEESRSEDGQTQATRDGAPDEPDAYDPTDPGTRDDAAPTASDAGYAG